MSSKSVSLSSLRARKRSAQQALRRQVFPKLVATCCAVLKDLARAEETAEDIWMDFLYEHVDKVKKEHAVAKYLRMMAVRRCVRMVKMQNRHDELDQHKPLQTGSENSVLDRIEQHRNLHQLNYCLKKLSKKAQKALRMRFHKDMTHESIGRAMGVSKQYSGRLVTKSLEKLRTCMEQSA